MKRKILSVLLALCMLLALMATPIAAAYQDTEGHWAEASIERWTGHGIVQGTENGFDPDGELTCAQLAAILARLLKLPEAPDAGFTDNPAEAWYYDSINRCAAAGILLGNGDGTVTPTAPITRERAIVMLSRALGIEPVENPDLSAFEDADAVADYAQGYVAALVAAGVIKGVTDETVGPQLNITRAATVAILDRAIAVYADTEGAEIDASEGGFILVAAENVVIKNAPAGTKVLVAPAAEDLTVNGKKVESDQTYIVPENKPTTPVHSHSYDTSKWVVDDTYHWHAANCGHDLTIDKAEHTFGDDNICTVCGQLKSSEAVAQINGKNYASLTAAIAAAVDGDTVTLVKDETQNTSLVIKRSITLDLNGKTIANTEDIWHDRDENVEGDVNIVSMLSIENGAKVTITGNGKIAAKENDCYAINILGGSELTIENGEFVGNVSVVQVQEGTLTVNGGTFSLLQKWGGSSKYLLNCIDAAYKDGSAKIVVKGGSFVDYDPSDSASENPHGNFVAEGYKATENDGTWTVEKITAEEAAAGIGDVYYLTLAAAIAAAEDGDTIMLCNDVTGGNVWLKDGVTLDLGGHTIDANGGYGLYAAKGINAIVKNGVVTNANTALIVWGTADAGDPTTVTIEKDVSFTDSTFGIIFTGYREDYQFTGKTGFAALNFNGKIEPGTKEATCGIFVMGNLGNDVTSAEAIGENGNQINIGENADIKSVGGAAIVLNGMAKLTVVDGAKIEGTDAVAMKRGYLNITGGKLKGTGEKHTPTDAEHSGSEESGSAITVSSTYNYSGLIDVKISGGVFESVNSYGFYAGQSVEDGQQIAFTNTTFAISGGSFSGDVGAVYFATGKHITGGTFSSDPSNYVAEGYKATVNSGIWTVAEKTYPAQVGGESYEELSDAIEASNSENNTITLVKDAVVILENDTANGENKSRTVTIKGDGTQTVDVVTEAVTAEGGELNYQRGSSFTFENLTIQAGEGNFDGIVCDELTFKNCTIKGKLALYGDATFIGCTFENTMANQYSIWTWGGKTVTFEGCTFNTNGKAILLYGQATAENPTNLIVTNCTFNDRNNGSAGKAAIEIGNDYNATYTLTVTGVTVNGFAEGQNTGSKLWANKNSMDSDHLTVTIDGTQVERS